MLAHSSQDVPLSGVGTALQILSLGLAIGFVTTRHRGSEPLGPPAVFTWPPAGACSPSGPQSHPIPSSVSRRELRPAHEVVLGWGRLDLDRAPHRSIPVLPNQLATTLAGLSWARRFPLLTWTACRSSSRSCAPSTRRSLLLARRHRGRDLVRPENRSRWPGDAEAVYSSARSHRAGSVSEIPVYTPELGRRPHSKTRSRGARRRDHGQCAFLCSRSGRALSARGPLSFSTRWLTACAPINRMRGPPDHRSMLIEAGVRDVRRAFLHFARGPCWSSKPTTHSTPGSLGVGLESLSRHPIIIPPRSEAILDLPKSNAGLARWWRS